MHPYHAEVLARDRHSRPIDDITRLYRPLSLRRRWWAWGRWAPTVPTAGRRRP